MIDLPLKPRHPPLPTGRERQREGCSTAGQASPLVSGSTGDNPKASKVNICKEKK